MTKANNGDTHAVDSLIDAMASRIKAPAVVERVKDRGGHFEQKAHTLLVESVDKMTQQWVDELVALRANSKTIEQMVIEQSAKVKHELTRLHVLGAAAMREAERGHRVLQNMGDELDDMLADRAAE